MLNQVVKIDTIEVFPMQETLPALTRNYLFLFARSQKPLNSPHNSPASPISYSKAFAGFASLYR
jgi:hypothetical protein